jgi:hypothetical protein
MWTLTKKKILFPNQCCRRRERERYIITSMKECEIKGLDNVSQLIKSLQRDNESESRF